MPRSNRSKQPAAILPFSQPLQKLEPNRGGYFYLTIPAAIVKQLPNDKRTRLVCTIENKVTLHCGLNHLGNGDFFIIVATKHVKALQLKSGDTVNFSIEEDAEPLGVEIPEVLQALLEQDEELKAAFDGMTDGKKRSLIFLVQGVKDVDKQVQKAVRFLADVKAGRSPFKRK